MNVPVVPYPTLPAASYALKFTVILVFGVIEPEQYHPPRVAVAAFARDPVVYWHEFTQRVSVAVALILIVPLNHDQYRVHTHVVAGPTTGLLRSTYADAPYCTPQVLFPALSVTDGVTLQVAGLHSDDIVHHVFEYEPIHAVASAYPRTADCAEVYHPANDGELAKYGFVVSTVMASFDEVLRFPALSANFT